jgi:putative ABC transport system ATP-binding protein
LRDVTCGPLDGFSLESRPGELLGLVVDDPAATATLMRLLVGETDEQATNGAVLLDGAALAELSVDWRRQRLLVNPHHPDLIEGTLRDNLDPEGRYDDATIASILEAVGANDIMQPHDDGLRQPVTANGATFSGGQRQRIALARALAADPVVLVLDDPTTAVDPVTEQRIAAGIRALRHDDRADRVTWVITTSPALLAQAARVVVVEGGRVVAEGTHRELTTQSAYRERVLR